MWAALLFIAVPCRFDGRRVIGRSRCRSPGSIHKSAMARQRGNAGDTGRQSRPDERYKLNLWICVKCPNFCLYLRLSSPYATIWPVTGQPQAMADQCQPICTLCYRLCRFDVITRSVQIVDIFKIGSSHIMLKIKNGVTLFHKTKQTIYYVLSSNKTSSFTCSLYPFIFTRIGSLRATQKSKKTSLLMTRRTETGSSS